MTCRKIQQHLQEGSFHTVISCSSVSQETATTILPCATSEWLRSHVGAQEKDSVCEPKEALTLQCPSVKIGTAFKKLKGKSVSQVSQQIHFSIMSVYSIYCSWQMPSSTHRMPPAVPPVPASVSNQ